MSRAQLVRRKYEPSLDCKRGCMLVVAVHCFGLFVKVCLAEIGTITGAIVMCAVRQGDTEINPYLGAESSHRRFL